jgi:hypothetical protein
MGALALPVTALELTAAQAENSAPIAEDLTLTTYKGVAIASRFAAVDPEGDLVTFQVVDSPARGQVTVDETDSAAFWYTPYEGKKGKDSFTYVAIDSNGNTSQPAKVKITIQKQTTQVTYADLAGRTCQVAAVRLAEAGVYVGRKVGDRYCFDADETFTRSEFLAMAMTAAGSAPLDNVTLTGFYDDETIDTWAKGYVSAAVVSGAIQGSANEQGQMVFRGDSPITCAEATVILDRLLVVGDVNTQSSFAAEAVPAWASQAVTNMEAVNVLSPAAALSQPLTRGEAAQMLSAMLDVLDARKG